MSRSPFHPPAVLLGTLGTCMILAALAVSPFATATPELPVHEDFMTCNVNDHEIFEDIMAYQEATDAESPETSTGRLMVRG